MVVWLRGVCSIFHEYSELVDAVVLKQVSSYCCLYSMKEPFSMCFPCYLMEKYVEFCFY